MMRLWRTAIVLAASALASPALAFAGTGEVRAGVRAQCTAWDQPTCERLARIAGDLVAAETVSDALAGEVASLPNDQGEWLAQALEAQLRQAELEGDDDAVVRDDRSVAPEASADAMASGAQVDGDRRGRSSAHAALLRAIEKARDFVRRTIGGRETPRPPAQT